ncbi:uncharacterized protein LY89DRAFT_484618 [Mollisia scopiformis]|uniref:Uncharacterized protein n=1 Tax=Mollisia scopiformis TaxID=149040 RepID=A0A194XGC3_MOLSC|nr:uncharacterized protein LY89DRAFT_484618 [Mollisia scopiformis]KUJ19218.1 hypothetical protein LY89DRAFT_484618 [Mollisia scopiformis]
MAVDSNGRLVEPGHKGMNGHATASRSKPAKKQQSFSVFSTISRLLTWYSIITILFRCPATVDLTDASPKICKPYFQVRSAITPHIEPYYDAYAAPYVDAARPYYETLDKRVISPIVVLSKKYGSPRVAQAQAFGQAQWEKNIQPEVSKYQTILRNQYDQTLGPHVSTAITTTSPYYDVAKNSALQTYYEHILPTYTAVQPYALQGYGIASDFAVNTAIPYSQWAWTTGVVFLDRTIWPKLRILYGENVEPQLVRIGERLGRYRDGKKIKAVAEEVDSSLSASSASQTFSSISSSIASAHETTIPQTSAPASTANALESPASTPLSEKEIREKAQKVVAHDLRTWQEKFAKAADEGSDDLEDRITEITERLVKNQAEKVGKAHIIELEETIKSSLESLKRNIISIVKDAHDSEESENALNAAVRKAGVAIKSKAQSVRTWRQSYDQETNSLVSKAAMDTLEILDHIRDLGLQEIGMRWAWIDGVTHKDWSKYHQLKTKFDEWRYDVEKVATEHPGLGKARTASDEVESQAMGIAEDAATELARLKETGRWKISAKDATDDFSTKIMPAAAVVAGQKVLEKVSELSEAVAPSSQGTLESVTSSIAESVVEGISAASSVAASQVDNAQSVASSVSASIVGTPQGTVESLVSAGSSSISSLAEQASSSIIGTQQGSVESVISVASESASSFSAQASSSILGEEPGVVSKVASDASSSISSAVSGASSAASQKVWGGAMAQHVEARQIIFEDVIDDSDDDTFSEKLQNMASQAGDKYSDIAKAVSEALVGTTSTEAFPVTKVAAEKYSSALSAASVALYGTEQGSGESISSVVSSRYADAVAAASSIIYGTPMPITASLAAQATDAYNAALSQASENYAHARSVVSAQISGEPKPVHEAMFSSVEAAYSDSVNAASSRLGSALSAASTAIYGTATPQYQAALASISAVAQSKLSEGLSAASAQFDSAKSYVAAVNTAPPAKQKLLGQMQDQYYAGIGMAHARYSEFLEAASSAVMPTQTPFHQSLYNKASENIVGTPTHKFQAALNTASAHFSSAMAAASAQYDDILASIHKIGGDAGGDTVPTSSLAAVASSRYNAAVEQASQSFASINSVISQKLESGASAASSAVIGSETPWTESVASAASENWELLVTKASSQIYGAPTPYFVTRRLLSEAREYAAQATEGAMSQYAAVQSLIGELVSGKEPDFTESVYNRFSSAYYTGAGQVASSASSYASEAYASASSVVSSVFTPPPTIEAILDSASSRVDEAVSAASVQFYGTEKGSYEQATSAAASAYSSVQSVASEKVYGTSAGYAEAAQSSIADAALSAQQAISEAIWGTPTGTVESVTNAAGEAYATAVSVVGEQYSAVVSRASEAIYGPEQGAIESAQSRLSAAVESARVRLAEFASSAGEGASDAVKQASEGVENFASSVSSAISSVTSHDEL